MARDGKLLVGYGAGGGRHEDWLAEENPVVEMLNPDELKAELKEKGMPFLPAERSPERERGMFVPAQAPYYGLAAHTASDIVLSAYSSGSDAWRAFTGVLDNTDVFYRIVQAVHGGAAGPR